MQLTTEYLDSIKQDCILYGNIITAETINKEQYLETTIEDYLKIFELFLYKVALDSYQQTSDGDTTDFVNCLSEEQMNDIVGRIKEIGEIDCVGIETGETNPDSCSDYDFLEFSQEDGYYIIV